MLQFITHTNHRYDYIDSAALALQGGCCWIQLRMKDSSDEEITETALKVKKLCRKYDATFIIDDHVDIALNVKADGVHLGKNDMPPAEARKILGKDFIIGGTANTIEDMEYLIASGVDYIGMGPFRFTETKKNLSPILGLEGYRKAACYLQCNGFSTPVVAIGGITADDIAGIMQTGIGGIALSGTILNAEDPVKETQTILNLIKQYSK